MKQTKKAEFKSQEMISFVKSTLEQKLNRVFVDDDEFALEYYKQFKEKTLDKKLFNWKQMNKIFGGRGKNHSHKYFHEVFLQKRLPQYSKQEIQQILGFVNTLPQVKQIRETADTKTQIDLYKEVMHIASEKFDLKNLNKPFKKIQDKIRYRVFNDVRRSTSPKESQKNDYDENSNSFNNGLDYYQDL